MATDAATLLSNAAAQGFQALSERELKMVTLYLLATGSSPGSQASVLLAGAYAQGYDRLSDRDLSEAIVAAAAQ